MKDDEIVLLLRSFDDENFDERERRRLDALLEHSATLRAEHVHLRRMRDAVSDSAATTFAPDFADRVMMQLEVASAPNVMMEQDRASSPKRNAETGQKRIPYDRQAPDRRTSRKPGAPSTARHGAATPGIRRWVTGGLAAAVVLLIAIGVIVGLQPRTISVPYGATQTLALSDGSTVELSGGSTLSHPRRWDAAERRVRLEGEAFFDVVAHEKPFVVETFNADVTVLGTQFNVRAWRNDPAPETAVALASGRVAVSARQAGAARQADRPDARTDELLTDQRRVEELHTDELPTEELRTGDRESSASALMARETSGVVVLEPGQTTSVTADSNTVRPPRSVSIDAILTWRSGGIAFVDQPLGSVFNTIERRFDIDIEPVDPAMSGRLLTYLNPDPGSAADVLSDICHTLDLRYRRTANGYEILPN